MPSNQAKGTGAKRKMSEREEDAALLIYDLDLVSVDKLAKVFDVTRQTIYNAVARARGRKCPGSRQHGAVGSGVHTPTDSSTGGAE